jgi:hypothetical protein
MYELRTDVTVADVRFAIIDELEGWRSATFKWLSPHERLVRKLPTVGLVFEAEKLGPILHTAARNAFWALGRNSLSMLASKLGLEPPEQKTVFGYLWQLTQHALPSLRPPAIMDILALRCPRYDAMSEFFLTPEATSHLEGLAGDDKQEVDRAKERLVKAWCHLSKHVSRAPRVWAGLHSWNECLTLDRQVSFLRPGLGEVQRVVLATPPAHDRQGGMESRGRP